MAIRLTILCDNSVTPQLGLLGEHGFSCLIETPGGAWLFDTGQGLAITQNSRVLGKDLSGLCGIVLSHGHYDHTGGLPEVLHRTGPVKIFAHPDVFTERYRTAGGHRRFIGLPYRRAHLESLGAEFHLSPAWAQIGTGIFASGEIPRQAGFQSADSGLITVRDGGEEPDRFADDLSLVVESAHGLVIVLGCAHAGLTNILQQVEKMTGGRKVYAVLGGTHLAFAGEAQFENALQALQNAGVERIGLSHCTGPEAAARLHSRLGSRVFFAGAGSILEA